MLITCLCIKTTEPSKRHVPPCLSTCNMRNICKNRIPRIALVANTCPFEPNVNTTIDATTTIKSVSQVKYLKKKNDMDILDVQYI